MKILSAPASTLRCRIRTVKLFCRVCGRSAACLKQPVMARSTAIAGPIQHRTDVFDRQKLTPIWPRFGLNNVSAWFDHIPVISQPTAGRAFPAVEARRLPRGTGRWQWWGRAGFEIVSRWLTRITAHGATSASGDLIQIPPTTSCISFGSTAGFSARPTSLPGTFIYRI
jgi:hypothetical protein